MSKLDLSHGPFHHGCERSRITIVITMVIDPYNHKGPHYNSDEIFGPTPADAPAILPR